MVEYIQEIVIPYCCQKRKELKLPANRPALVLFDVFKGQCTEPDWSLLESSDIHIVTVPANMAGNLQPLVVNVNKAAKDFLRGTFKEWYAEKVVEGDQGIVILSGKMDKENTELRGKRLKLVKNTAIMYRYLSSATTSPSKRFRHASAEDLSYLSESRTQRIPITTRNEL